MFTLVSDWILVTKMDAVAFKRRHQRGSTNACRVATAVVLALLVLSIKAEAIPGDLDSTFGSNGIVSTRIGQYNAPNAVAMQIDGKILTVGFSRAGSTNDFALARYNANGTLDLSFNGTGVVTTPVGLGTDNAVAVAIQPDSKIVLAGNTQGMSFFSFAVVRLNLDGSLDTTFNGTGKVITTFSGQSDAFARAVAIQPDGKIIVAGQGSNGTGGTFALVRYNSDGSPDTSFNGTGTVFTASTKGANAVSLQFDGKIVVAGAGANNHFTVARYNASGSLDTSFNGTGIVVTPIHPTSDEALAVAIQPDGKIVAAGRTGSLSDLNDIGIARCNADGTRDISFNGTGVVVTQIGTLDDNAYGVAVQSNGKIVVVGSTADAQFVTRFAIVRYNSTGMLDGSFNGTGIVITPSTHEASAVAIQPDGKIVAVGDNALSFSPVFVVARYLGDMNPNRIANFDVDNRSDISIWNPTDHNWYVLNSSSNTLVVREGWGSGSLGDQIVPGDYDGDGRTDFAVYRPAEGGWYISQSADGSLVYKHWGDSTDIPVPGDYDLDGKTDVAVYRESEGNWYILNSRNNSSTLYHWGAVGDRPAPADYDGDGATDVTVYRPSEGNWYIIESKNRFTRVVRWGIGTDQLVPADYDGDGRIEIAVFRSTEGSWFIRLWGGSVIFMNWGASSDIPVPADYDGDGRTDIAVYRPSEVNWYIIQSATNTIRYANLERSGVPVPSGYLPR